MNEKERVKEVRREKKRNKDNGNLYLVATIIFGVCSIFSFRFIGVTIISALFALMSLINFRDLERIE